MWDWLSVLAFGGLVTLMLQRSAEGESRAMLLLYMPPAVGFAVVNYLGNLEKGLSFLGRTQTQVLAGLLLVGCIVYIFKVLKVSFRR